MNDSVSLVPVPPLWCVDCKSFATHVKVDRFHVTAECKCGRFRYSTGSHSFCGRFVKEDEDKA